MGKFILIGIPNCGKTTLGKRAAELLQIPFFDTDSLTVNRMNLENPFDIFRSAFNGRFMIEQLNVMNELDTHEGSAIIATGAEIALMPECVKLMKKMGTVIHIHRNPINAIDSLKNNDHRMVMSQIVDGKETSLKIDMQEEAVKMYAKELAHYEALANFTLENNGSEDEGLEKLITLIEEQGR